MDRLNLEHTLREFISSPERMRTETELCKIMRERGSDKRSDWHNYTPIYSLLFERYREQAINFFELGIFHGASVRGWSDYFRGTHIHCADIDPSYFITEDNITSHFCDQDDVMSIQKLWSSFDIEFDVIIEDGKHEFSSSLNFLVNSFHKLRKGGLFIIEDLTRSTQTLFEAKLVEIKRRLDADEMFILNIPNETNTIDNCLLVALR